jgi:hypothetical protein
MANPIALHRIATFKLAKSLKPADVYKWLLQHGYFPESYVLPPCFRVLKHPTKLKPFFKVIATKKGGTIYHPKRTDYAKVHFPKTELTDRVFGVIDPEIHNDIAFHIAKNWLAILKVIFSTGNRVTSYSFPIPINNRTPGRVGYLRSGRLIYEFLSMAEKDVAAVAYQYTHIVKTDVKNFGN